ncbi:hypothetical protein ATCC90586_004518 [Pythium insidiosum]|nr:hypothetical protein ATCC90586_004518 [Pythium insidiosum]
MELRDDDFELSEDNDIEQNEDDESELDDEDGLVETECGGSPDEPQEAVPPQTRVFATWDVDSFGQSQFIHHAFLKNERKETIETVVCELIRTNPEADAIKCFMIDNHFTEISVLRSAFPNATVLLCQFHAVKYLREIILKYDLSPQQCTSLKDAIGLIVYASSEDDYNKILAYVRRVIQPQHTFHGGAGVTEDDEGSAEPFDILSSDDTSGFYDYFIRNWHECRKMWCSFERDNVETYDEVMSDFANIVTDYAAQLVLPEYKFAVRAVYHYEGDAEGFRVQSTSAGAGARSVYNILKATWSNFRIRYAQPFTQTDSYNCGIFVLMFADYVIHNRSFPQVDRNLLQYLRYRYFCLGL